MVSTEIREVRSDAERTQLFRLRYDIYCQKLGWIDPAQFPEQLESDIYDPTAKHFIALEDGRAIGTIRLVYPGDLPFPMEAGFPAPTQADLEATPTERTLLAEVSRLIVDPRNHCPRHAVSLGLLQVLIRASVHGGLTHWLQALDKVSFRLIQSFGFRMHQFAPMQVFMGSETIPTAIRIDRCMEEFQLHNLLLFDFLSGDIDPTDVVTSAATTLHLMHRASV